MGLRTLLFALAASTLVALPSAQGQPYDQYDIYAFDQRTGTTRQVTAIPNRGEFNPAWSPDGRRIVHDVVQFASDGSVLGQDLYITDVTTRRSRPLAGGAGGNDAAWHPDRNWIAFDRAPAGDPSLYLVSAAGGTPRLVRADAVDPSWSPDGMHVVFHQPSDGTIRALNIRTGAVVLVSAKGITPFWDYYGGEYIAFAHDGNLYQVRVDPSGAPIEPVRTITADVALDGAPAYSPTTKFAVFHSDRGGDFDIWSIYTFGGGTPVRVTGRSGADDYDPAPLPGTEWIAYAGLTPSKSKGIIAADEEKEIGSKTPAVSSYPNPFNPTATISFTLPEATDVALTVYDVRGREVAVLVKGPLAAGVHEAHFDAERLPSGTYFYRLQAGAVEVVKQMVLLK